MSKISQKGSALVMSLLIGFMATVLGTALYSVSTANARQVQQQSNQLQADYYAKSGVNLALGIIMNHEGTFLVDSDVNKKTYYGNLEGLSEVDPGDDSYAINVIITYHENDDSYTIESYGYLRGTGQQGGGASVAQSSSHSEAYCRITRGDVVRHINENQNNPNDPDDPNNSGVGQPPSLDKIFAVGVNKKTGKAVELSGSPSISGNVGVNSILEDSVTFAHDCFLNNGDLYIGPGGNVTKVVTFHKQRSASTNIPNGTIKNLSSIQSYPLPTFPSFPSFSPIQSMNAGWWPLPASGKWEISQSGQYSSINVTNQLTINIGNQDVIIRTGILSVTGSGQIILNRTGTGKLIVYVDNKFTLNGSSTINNNGDYNSLIMYYAGTDSINVDGNTRFIGSIYAQIANVDIQGSGGITGHIVTGGSKVNVTGDARANVRAIYAPQASMVVSGSGMVKGAVVANDIDISGGSGNRIAYDNSFSTAFFDQLEWPGTGDNNTADDTPPPSSIMPLVTWCKSIND